MNVIQKLECSCKRTVRKKYCYELVEHTCHINTFSHFDSNFLSISDKNRGDKFSMFRFSLYQHKQFIIATYLVH